MTTTIPMVLIPLAVNLLIKTIVPTFIFPNLYHFLDNESVLFSTPIDSFKTLKEGWYMMTQLQMNPYDSMINHQPILLELTKWVLDLNNNDKLMVNLIYAIADTIIFYNFLRLLQGSSKTGVWIYLLNPLIMLSTISRNTTIFAHAALMMSLANLLQQHNYKMSLVQLSIASYLSFPLYYIMIPVVVYIKVNTKLPYSKMMIHYFIPGVLITSALLYLHHFNFGGFVKVFNNTFKSVFVFEKIQPNLGIWWYFFMEMFDFFHDFYIGIFNMYGFVFVIPFTYRFNQVQSQDRGPAAGAEADSAAGSAQTAKTLAPNCANTTGSIFAIMVSILWVNFTKSYPTITDLNLSILILFSLGGRYLNRLRVPILLTAIILSVVLVLLILFYYLWVNLNSGNSNFFYGVGLVYNVIIAWTICDLIWVYLQEEYRDLNNLSDDDNVKLTQF